MAANLLAIRRQRTQQAQRRTARTASIPAPIGGWNARDPLGEMPSTDAISLENFWPLPYDVQLRKGYVQSVTGFPAAVETLMTYSNPTTRKLFAASSTKFFDASTPGAVGAAVMSGLTNARWESINVSTSGGNFLMSVNGHDKLRGYDGSAWWTDGDGAHDITGVDTATCSNINLFKNRVWLVQGSSLKAWYLPTSAIAGAATAFDLQSIARLGGYLVCMGTWTVDGGYGVDDLAVFITSQGEVIVYRGIDPANAATWVLAGVWQIGSPFTTRCQQKFGGDILLLTYDGIYPLSQALQSDRLDPRVAITNKIYDAISTATANYGTNFGWNMQYYAKANMLIINVPVSGTAQQQYCMNTITKAWTNFTGVAANCFAIYKDEPYFGGTNFVGQFWDGFSDNATNITGNAKQAFNYFGMRGQTKRWTMIRPTLRTTGTPSALVGLNIDFTDFDPTGQLAFTPTAYATWDSSLWDTGIWGGGLNVSSQWQGANGQGYCAAMRLKVAAMGIETHWASTDFVMEPGAVL
jgi:hypothetical protein